MGIARFGMEMAFYVFPFVIMLFIALASSQDDSQGD